MERYAWEDDLQECEMCGEISLTSPCHDCTEQDRTPEPKKPQELKKRDPKRMKKTSRRRDKHGREYDY